MRRLLVFMALFNGCGTHDAANGPTTPVSTSTAPSVGPVQEPPKEPVTASTAPIAAQPAAVPGAYTMLVSQATIPACSPQNVDQLIYVKDIAQFQSCDGSAWSQVDIPVAAGKDGKDGAAGKDGSAGAQGPAGAVTITPTNEWLDPVTNRLWLVGGASTTGPSCTAPWLIPTVAEGTAAIVHGLNSVAITHPSDMWTSDQAYPNCAGGVLSLLGGGYTGCLGPHGAYCVK